MTRGMARRGWASYGVDVQKGKWHDLLSFRGMLLVLALFLRTAEGALVWFGTCCDSWVFLSRSKSRRSTAFPSGSEDSSTWVYDSNVLASRTLLYIRLAEGLRHIWCLEQPSSSLLAHYWRFQERLGLPAADKIWVQVFRLIHWGGRSPKPIRVWSNHKDMLLVPSVTPSFLVNRRLKNTLVHRRLTEFVLWADVLIVGKAEDLVVFEAPV